MLKYVDELTRIDVDSEYIILKKVVSYYDPKDDEAKRECVFESEKIRYDDKEWNEYPIGKKVFTSYVPYLNEETLYEFVQTCKKIIEEKTTDVYKGDITEIYFYDERNNEPKYFIIHQINCGSMVLSAKDLRKKDEEELPLI